MVEFDGGWIANLSNGETVVELPGEPGEPKAWRRLLRYCKREGLKVTALRLTREGVSVFAAHHRACDGYFQGSEAITNMKSGETKTRQGIGSVIGQLVFITWLDTTALPEVQVIQDIRSLEEVIEHTTLQ